MPAKGAKRRFFQSLEPRFEAGSPKLGRFSLVPWQKRTADDDLQGPGDYRRIWEATLLVHNLETR